MAACHGRGHRNEHRGVQRNGADHGTTGMAAVRGPCAREWRELGALLSGTGRSTQPALRSGCRLAL